MISVWWVPLALFAGLICGVVLMALLVEARQQSDLSARELQRAIEGREQ